MRLLLVVFIVSLTNLLIAADTQDSGKKAEQQSCIACHSLRLIESQRLSSAAWKKEISKMIGWGAVVPDQQVLLDYLSTQYGDTKPVPEPERSSSSNK